ncbi:MAG TPA: pyridoxal 5'-phosphate synthase [Pseudonocardiaceae bacterium]|jgi:pyridoxamine 5'-phosphate oxidase|nr:pyridoxal 5'-phosphate synthase [Pseudonocardiaceae bacterium]
MSDLAGRLRSIRVFGGNLPTFDPDTVPDHPTTLFTEWLVAAIDAGAVEPHVVVLSTVDGAGHPDARALILKDVDEDGWWFASSSAGPKGAQLANNPWAALTCYWPVHGRQVRVRGQVYRGTPEDAARDFLARAPGGRAEALVGRQSQHLADRRHLEAALHRAEARLAADPDLVAADWTRYQLRPREVQFFQGDPARQHVRVRYTVNNGTWSHSLLWP